MTPTEFKAWRKALGWTQTQVAKALDLSLGTVGNYEMGRRREGGEVVIPKVVELACRTLSAEAQAPTYRKASSAPPKAPDTAAYFMQLALSRGIGPARVCPEMRCYFTRKKGEKRYLIPPSADLDSAGNIRPELLKAAEEAERLRLDEEARQEAYARNEAERRFREQEAGSAVLHA